MKLSQMSTDGALDALCQIAPLVADIVTDPEIRAELSAGLDASKGNTLAERFALTAEKLSNVIPLFLKNRRESIFGILAVLNETDVERIAKQNIMQTMKQIRDIVKDKELLDFFQSCTSMEGSE